VQAGPCALCIAPCGCTHVTEAGRLVGPEPGPFAEDGTNLDLAIGSGLVDPVSGTQPLKSWLCEVRRLQGAA
jgi:hypothetical protein